jgi:hypothetical protein
MDFDIEVLYDVKIFEVNLLLELSFLHWIVFFEVTVIKLLYRTVCITYRKD